LRLSILLLCPQLVVSAYAEIVSADCAFRRYAMSDALAAAFSALVSTMRFPSRSLLPSLRQYIACSITCFFSRQACGPHCGNTQNCSMLQFSFASLVALSAVIQRFLHGAIRQACCPLSGLCRRSLRCHRPPISVSRCFFGWVGMIFSSALRCTDSRSIYAAAPAVRFVFFGAPAENFGAYGNGIHFGMSFAVRISRFLPHISCRPAMPGSRKR